MMTEEITEDEEDEDETTAFRSASALLDELARDVPSKHVYKPVTERITMLLQSQDAAQHRAAVAALGILCEGCSAPLKKNLPQLLTVLFRAMSHTHPKVREYAYSSLSQFSEFLIPDIEEHHEQILPALAQGLSQEPSFAILSKICVAIDSFCEYLEGEIVPYLAMFMEKLLSLLAKGDRNTQVAVIPAIGNIARAAGAAIAPYFPTILTICKQLMEQTDSSVLELRARATECLGIVAVAAGKHALGTDVVDGFMHLAL
jgi:importin-4